MCVQALPFIFKAFKIMITRIDLLDLNLQKINTRRQTDFENRNHWVYKVVNNILANSLSCLTKKITLDMLNVPIEPYKRKCKSMFLL